jgi:hypothetical protein
MHSRVNHQESQRFLIAIFVLFFRIGAVSLLAMPLGVFNFVLVTLVVFV